MKNYLRFAFILMINGCSQWSRHSDNTTPDLPVTNSITSPNNAYKCSPEVVRYDRYLLVNTSPTAAQRMPLEQIIYMQIPNASTSTVESAIRFILQQSGYSLCNRTPVSTILYPQPLPKGHYKLGPMTLSNALRVLAGDAWQLDIDTVQRQVCYSLRQELVSAKTALVTTASEEN